MGKRLYCFITGRGVLINWGKKKGLIDKNEEEAWKIALNKIYKQKKQNEWQRIYDNWNNGNWGQMDSNVGLNECIIWIKKKNYLRINKKVELTHAKNIISQIEQKLNDKKIKDIDEIIILVHAFNGIDKKVTTRYRYTTINRIPIKWYGYTAGGKPGGGGRIDLVKIAINAIYSCNLSNLCDKFSEALKEPEKRIESSEKNRLLSLLKHQIVNILEPLRIDIEGLMDKNFEDSYWEKVSNYWKGNRINNTFKELEKAIEKFLKPETSKDSEIKQFVEKLKKEIENINSYEQLNKLLTAIKIGDKKTVQDICKLYGNVYKIWMDELVNEFEKVKSNL
jgi:hypothetical protein